MLNEWLVKMRAEVSAEALAAKVARRDGAEESRQRVQRSAEALGQGLREAGFQVARANAEIGTDGDWRAEVVILIGVIDEKPVQAVITRESDTDIRVVPRIEGYSIWDVSPGGQRIWVGARPEWVQHVGAISSALAWAYEQAENELHPRRLWLGAYIGIGLDELRRFERAIPANLHPRYERAVRKLINRIRREFLEEAETKSYDDFNLPF